ncbi:MAG: SIS domain-containing protein [Gemmatimonadota bacterium]
MAEGTSGVCPESRTIDSRSLTAEFDEHESVFHALREQCLEDIYRFAVAVGETISRGHQVLFCGNGGSAAQSQHLAAELVGRFQGERTPLPALALSSNTSVLTAIANDYGYSHVFQRQVQALGRPKDLLIGISTSGHSENVLRAVDQARELGLTTAGLTGRDGGRLASRVDYCVKVPSDSTARIQDAHGFIGHLVCRLVEQEFILRHSSGRAETP